jgi:preprotein translocase subunit SecG
MSTDFKTIAIVVFYILAFALAFILSAKTNRGFRDLSQFLQEDWPEKWLEISDVVISRLIVTKLFYFVRSGKIFKSARIALAVKQLRENYTAFLVVFFIDAFCIVLVICSLYPPRLVAVLG